MTYARELDLASKTTATLLYAGSWASVSLGALSGFRLPPAFAEADHHGRSVGNAGESDSADPCGEASDSWVGVMLHVDFRHPFSRP